MERRVHTEPVGQSPSVLHGGAEGRDKGDGGGTVANPSLTSAVEERLALRQSWVHTWRCRRAS